MIYPIREAAERLGTDRVRVLVENGWMEATPEASIIRVPIEITIEDAYS